MNIEKTNPILPEAYFGYYAKSDNERILEQKKQFAYYAGEFSEIESYLDIALKNTWRDYTVNKMPKSYLNIVKKIIDSLSALYNEKPIRKVFRKGKEDKTLSEYYNSILDPNVNRYDKILHRYAKLHNTAFPVISYSKGVFKSRLSPAWLYSVTPDIDDHLVIDKLEYYKYFKGESGEDELFKVVWTDGTHYRENSHGEASPLPNMKGIENPYGVIPTPIMRFNTDNSFWGEGQNILVNESEIINVLLSKLNYDDIILGTAGILFGTNLGNLSSNNEGGDTTITGGRDAIIRVENKSSQNNTPTDLKYVSTNPQIDAVMGAIDWKIKAIAMSLGLNPTNFSVANKAESGFSRLIESVEQMEVKQSDIDACREYETNRFDIIRTMNNSLELKTIPQDAELRVDFIDTKPTLSGADLWIDRAEREKRNLNTVVDWVMEDNPDIVDVNQAKTVLDDNKKINEEYKVAEPMEIDPRRSEQPSADGDDIGEGMASE